MKPVPYSPELETLEPNEEETTRQLCRVLRSIMSITAADCGRGLRAVHAKSHGLLEGEFSIAQDLSPVLEQGLFDRAGRYRALMRISTIPGDILDDQVSVPRGIALKVLDVPGSRLRGSEYDTVQDFILVDAPTFSAPTAASFLPSLRLLAKTTDRAQSAKIALSKVLRQVERGLESVGNKSALITLLGGHRLTNPLSETYYSQTPFRYGAYVGKFSLTPVSSNLTALKDKLITLGGRRNGLREEIDAIVSKQPTVWDFKVQLLTNSDTMPIEDSSVRWPEDESPFYTVAQLTCPPQPGWCESNSPALDERLAFSVWRSLAAHKPMGSINRARQSAYKTSAHYRGQLNGCPLHFSVSPSTTTSE